MNNHRISPNRLVGSIFASLCMAAISTTSYALESTSTASGGSFGDASTWQIGGTPVSGANNTFYLQSGATVTLNSGFTSGSPAGIAKLDNSVLNIGGSGNLQYNGGEGLLNQATLYFIAGASTVNIQSGGNVYSPRVTVAASASANVNISGTLSVRNGTWSFGTGGSATVTINTGGVYQLNASSFGSSGSSVYNISGGTMLFTRPEGTSSFSTHNTFWNVSSGKVDFSGYQFTWSNPFANMNWTGGTMANVSGITSNGTNLAILSDFGSTVDTTIDINTSGAARTWDIADIAMNRVRGNLQFDIFDIASSDAIEGGTGTWNLFDGVKIEIGFAGELIADPNDYVGQSFNLFTGFSDYAGFNADVLDALWFDGTNYWEVTFASNLSTDGSVTIASMEAVPEPSVVALAVLGFGLVLFRFRRKAAPAA